MKHTSRFQATVLVLFFLSGATGLVYEVVWHRMLVLVFGSTAFATATILASFMFGLALGSFCFGRLADRYRDPLKVYAYLEAGIGVFALLFPVILSGVTAAYVGIYQQFDATFYLFSLLRFILSFLILVIPSFLMGGTLPVLSKLFIREFGRLGAGIGSLYGTNTLGAVVGTFSAGFFFIILFGAKETTYIAAAVNILVAAAAFGLSRFAPLQHQDNRRTAGSVGNRQPDRQPGQPGRQPYPPYVYFVILGVYGLSGFCALAYEVLWTRVLVFYVHSTTYAFTIMLTSFLLGIAVGSLFFGRLIDKSKQQLGLLAAIEVLIGLFAILSIWEFRTLDDLMVSLTDRMPSWQMFVVARYAGAFLIMFIPTLLMGIAFPLASKIYSQNRERLGRYVGNIYSVNTVGSVLGSIAAGFVMIPLIGITNGIILVASLNLILGIVILLAHPFMGRTAKWAVVAGIAVIIPVAGAAIPTDRPLGLYSRPFRDLEEGGKVLFYDEGIGATVTVHQLPPDPADKQVYKLLEVDGVNVAGTMPTLRLSQKLQGHLPVLLYKASTGKDPRNVFLLGMGTGASSYAATRHRIDRLDVLEIVAAEIDALPFFREINRDILSEPKVRIRIDDARNFLLATQEEYDVIESDTIHPEQNANVFSREYFELARERLSEDGVFSVWLPMYGMSEETFKILINTLYAAFPHVTVWYASTQPTRHALLVGSRQKLKIDYGLLQEELAYPPVRESLAEVGLDDVFAVLGSFITDESRLSGYVADSLVSTDNRPYLAYYNPVQKGRFPLTEPRVLQIFAELSLPVLPYVVNMGAAETRIRTTLENRSQARTHVLRAIAHDYGRDYTNSISELENAQALTPDDGKIKNLLKLARAKQFADAEKRAQPAVTEGARLLKAGRLAAAEAVFRSVLEFHPTSAVARYSLATIHYARGEHAQATEELLKVIELYPGSVDARYSLAIVQSMLGEHDQAELQLKEVLRLAPDHQPARTALENLNDAGR